MITKLKFKIEGMHCSSCAMNIDGELEDTRGVNEANTNFARAMTEVTFDKDLISQEKIIQIIKNTGYRATPQNQ